jgi:hypothetical protein
MRIPAQLSSAIVTPVVRAIGLTRFSIAALLRVVLMILMFSVAARVLAQSAGVAADSATDGALLGLWGTEQVFGPLVRGSLTIDGRGSQWRASIAGFDVPVVHGLLTGKT